MNWYRTKRPALGSQCFLSPAEGEGKKNHEITFKGDVERSNGGDLFSGVQIESYRSVVLIRNASDSALTSHFTILFLV